MLLGKPTASRVRRFVMVRDYLSRFVMTSSVGFFMADLSKIEGLFAMSDTTKITPTTARLIPLPEVSRITSLKKTSIYQLIAAGELRPVKLGRKTVFSEAEIHDWVEARLANRESI